MAIVGSESSTQGIGNQWRTAPVTRVGFADPWIDAFSRVRVSDTANRFDAEFLYDKQPELFDEVLGGTGAITFNANPRDLSLANGGATVADFAGLYTHYDIPYTPGNSQLVEITGVLDYAGLGSGVAQFFVRSSVSGAVVETAYDQTDWTNQVADMDWTKSQIFTADFQSLRVGRLRFGFNRSGVPVKCLDAVNDNIRNSGYWQTPNLPAYWRVYNDTTHTYMEMGYGDTANAIGVRYRVAVNAGASMRAICVTVKSEGGVPILEMPGYPRSADNGVTPVTVSTTLIPILSIRVKSTFQTLANRALYIPTGFSITADNPLRFVLLYRPTLTGASWADVDTASSGMELDVAATAVSGGIRVYSDYFSTGKNQLDEKSGLLDRVIMALGRSGTSDILTLAAVRNGTTDASTQGVLRWREVR